MKIVDDDRKNPSESSAIEEFIELTDFGTLNNFHKILR
jgi:hypothetical protein